jgi:hypothetical protein
MASEQWRPWDQAYARFVAEFIHLALFFTITQAVVVLHADELGPAVSFRSELHLGKLVGPHRAGSDVAHLARLDKVMECFHRLLDRDRGIKAVDLQQVDVVGSKSFQGCIDRIEDCNSREAWNNCSLALQASRACPQA